MPKHVRAGRDANRAACRAERDQAEAVATVLAAAGLAFRLERGGRHLCVVVEGYRITIAGTPRDPDHAITYARQSAQRVVRSIQAGARK